MAIQRLPRGTRVVTRGPYRFDWNEGLLRTRQFPAEGVIIDYWNLQHTSACYEVRHQDGTVGFYEHTEVVSQTRWPRLLAAGRWLRANLHELAHMFLTWAIIAYTLALVWNIIAQTLRLQAFWIWAGSGALLLSGLCLVGGWLLQRFTSLREW